LIKAFGVANDPHFGYNPEELFRKVGLDRAH
jgi:hypothetical protein